MDFFDAMIFVTPKGYEENFVWGHTHPALPNHSVLVQGSQGAHLFPKNPKLHFFADTYNSPPLTTRASLPQSLPARLVDTTVGRTLPRHQPFDLSPP
jgi:hypothetical protein